MTSLKENFDSESYAEFIRFYDTSPPATARHERAGSRIVLNLKAKNEENRKPINL